jgi:glycosyltransferase involved in cell wall biosynthesis
VLPLPAGLSSAALRLWLREHALDADLLVGANVTVLRELRELGWRGRAVCKALGELPRGAAGLRAILPHLDGRDVVWCSCAADLQIYSTLVASGGPQAVLVPYGLEDGAFRPLGPGARERLRRRWGLERRDFVLVYAGRVTVEKNVHALLDVVGRLRRDGCPATLLVAGSWHDVPFEQFCVRPGDLRARLTRGLGRHVRLLPPLNDTRLNDLYNLADVCVNLTLHHDENFGYAQVEAMSAGLPVVATAWGGLRDTVVDGVTGFLADTWLTDHGIRFDLPAVVEALEILAADPALRASLAASAEARARREYSRDAYRARLRGLIAPDCAGGGTARYTPFGAAYDARFPGVAPVYRGFSDRDYATLIEPYTSLGWPRPAPGSRLFAATPGSLGAGWFDSSDILWPGRIPVSEPEAAALRCLDSDVPAGIVAGLLRKGLAGITRSGAPAGRYD